MRPSRARALTGLGLLWCLASGLAGPAADPESRIKSAMVFNLSKVVTWPASAGGDACTLGVLGQGPTARALETLDGRLVGGTVLRVRPVQSAEDLSGCRILFVCQKPSMELPDALAALAGAATLTVGERERFARDGGMVELARRNNRVRLVINLAAAQRAGLKIPAQLLQIAEVVTEVPRAPAP